MQVASKNGGFSVGLIPKREHVCDGCKAYERHEHRCHREIRLDDIHVRVVHITGSDSIHGRGLIYEGMLSQLNDTLLKTPCQCECNR